MADKDIDSSTPAQPPESAADRAHGTHGKGDTREKRLDDAPVQPGHARGGDATRGSDGWGSEGAGGSVIDKRPDE